MVHMFYSSDRMTWLRYICIKSFKIQYPDIPLKLWITTTWNSTQTWETVERQDFTEVPSEGDDYLGMLEDVGVEICHWEPPVEVTGRFGVLDPVHQSDIFRYWILSQEGGYFCDTDILFLNDSLKPLLSKPRDAVCYCGYYPIGFIGGKGEGSVWKEVYDACLHTNQVEYQSFGATLIKQLWFDVPPNVTNIPKKWFYNYDNLDIERMWNNELPLAGLPAIHIYCGHPLTQIYNRLLTEENYTEYPSTVTNAIRSILK